MERFFQLITSNITHDGSLSQALRLGLLIVSIMGVWWWALSMGQENNVLIGLPQEQRTIDSL